MKHWAADYIGIPWVSGGNDLDGFDCWGLFRFIQKQHYGIELPIIDIDAHCQKSVLREFGSNPQRKFWQSVAVPQDGDGVLMRMASAPCHVGVWVEDEDGGGVLHCHKEGGTVFHKAQNLSASFWKIIGYYRYAH
jgi:cell wall-associated NlpC family hydrolase